MKKFPIENVNSVIITALPRIVAYLRIAKRFAKGIESAVHPPRSGPPSPRGEGLNAAKSGRDLQLRQAKPFAGIGFAVILLSKAMNVGRDHLIHRKRSPFPYEGKDLTRLKISENYNVERGSRGV